MFSTDRTSPIPSEQIPISKNNDLETESTPEFNLLLDKLTEILRFRTACRRHQQHYPSSSSASLSSSSTNTTGNLKRLQSAGIDPGHFNRDVSSINSSTAACKSSHVQSKLTITNRSSHHHQQVNCFGQDKKRRLPCLLQRLIDEGNLIKEAVRRLKTQRFSPSCQQQNNLVNTPSTPSTKSSFSNLTLSSASINIPPTLNDSPPAMTSSPNLGFSWFLSSSENGSPLRTLMEIGIHDG